MLGQELFFLWNWIGARRASITWSKGWCSEGVGNLISHDMVVWFPPDCNNRTVCMANATWCHDSCLVLIDLLGMKWKFNIEIMLVVYLPISYVFCGEQVTWTVFLLSLCAFDVIRPRNVRHVSVTGTSRRMWHCGAQPPSSPTASRVASLPGCPWRALIS